MQNFNANIVDSNTYLFNKKNKFEDLMDQEWLYTIWLTLSAADNHWVDLHKTLYKLYITFLLI